MCRTLQREKRRESPPVGKRDRRSIHTLILHSITQKFCNHDEGIYQCTSLAMPLYTRSIKSFARQQHSLACMKSVYALYIFMRYINPRFTYLLTYLYSACLHTKRNLILGEAMSHSLQSVLTQRARHDLNVSNSCVAECQSQKAPKQDFKHFWTVIGAACQVTCKVLVPISILQ